MGSIDFKFGTLIRTGPKLTYGGKWDADLVDWKIDYSNNAYLTIFIRIFFAKIDPAGQTGTYGDTDDTAAHSSKKPIQKWKPGEFEQYVSLTESESGKVSQDAAGLWCSDSLMLRRFDLQ